MRTIKPEDIEDGAASIVALGGERVAIFRNGDLVSCVSNVCRHQMGPIGEGRIIDGCITCPWHGYQYDPENGCSPPPFTERIETYDVVVFDGYIWVNPTPNPLGTSAQTARVEALA